MVFAALLLLLSGLVTVALPDSTSGPVVWALDSLHGLRLADVIGALMMGSGSALIWLISLIRQWQCAD